MELIKQLLEMPTGNFDLRDPEMDPGAQDAMNKAYSDLAARAAEAVVNWPKVAKALGGTLKIHKAQGVAGNPPFAVVDDIKVEGSLKNAVIEAGWHRSSQILRVEPKIDSRNTELVGVIKHVWKKATGGLQLYTGGITGNGLDIGFFSSMPDKEYQKIVKGIQAVLEVLGDR